MHLSARELARAVESAEGDAFLATRYRVDLQRRLAESTACVLLPALAVFVTVASRRRPSVTRSLLAAAGLGVGYLLLADVAVSLGYGGRLPPAASAWAPPALVATGAAILLARSRR
jgi:lipopolysaccharide export LptBFGC system permease protein LptF